MLIRVDGGPWRQPSGSGYANEAALKQLLMDYPSLIPGVVDSSAVCDEFQSGVGPADVVVVDGDGALTLVECKLAANPQVRREVIGQVLDYASRLWRMPIEVFESQWSARKKESLAESLGDETGTARTTLQKNLNDSRFRIVLAVDQINDDLRRIVEYLNAITQPSTSIVAVEFVRVHDGPVEILTPNTYGEELAEAKEAADPGRRPRWTIDQYKAWAAENNPQALPAIDAFLAALAEGGFQIGGGRAGNPSLVTSISVPGLGDRWPVCLHSYSGQGSVVEVRFRDYRNQPEIAERYAVAVANSPGVDLDLEGIRQAGYKRMPNIRLASLTPEQASALATAIATALGAEEASG